MKTLERFVNHGGAWKVAYADFTTGMMALFMVLWILSMDEEVVKATTRYFQDPYMAGVPKSSPVSQPEGRKGSMVDQIMGRSDSTMKNSDETSSIDIAILYQIMEDFYRRLKINEIKPEDPIQIEVKGDHVRVVMPYNDDRPLFVGNTPKLTDWGVYVMQGMSWILEKHIHLDVRIDSHSAVPTENENFDPWELSIAQGNEVRKTLNYYGLEGSRMEQLSSYGDSMPLIPKSTEKPLNKDSKKHRRLELSLVIRKDM